MESPAFALAYAWRNLQRGGARSLFAAFCVAVGVAAVVGMQLLALNISASVNRAPQEANGGDISVDPITTPFQASDLAKVERLRRQGVIVAYTATLNGGRGGVKATAYGLSTLISVRGIDPATYPLYGQFIASRPSQSVSSLLRTPTDAVITQDLFDRLHLRIGDQVTLGAAISEVVTVRGIVTPGGLFQGDFGIGGTIYQPIRGLDAASPQTRGPGAIAADKLFIRTQDAAHTRTALAALRRSLGPFFRYTTADQVAKQAVANTMRLQQLLLACGLLALLIGGIGIVNTMLVSVGRRTKEIAVLKTLGLRGYQVIPLFLMEALLLGLAGSLLGILGGIGLSAAITTLAVQLGATVSWSLRPSPLVVGAVLGIVATAVFGFLPVLRAGRTRPIGVLRDEDAPLPRIGWLVTSGVMIVLTGAMGIAAGVVLHNLLLGIGLAYGVVILFLLFSGIFLLVVTAAGHGPAFGSVDLRLALRNLTRQKRRVASTLVALCIGMLAVGTVVVLAQNVRADLNRLFNVNYGFNVATFSPIDQEAATLQETRRLPGLQHTEQGLLVAGLRLIQVDSQPAARVLRTSLSNVREDIFAFQTMDGRDLRVAKLHLTILKGGRALGPADEGTANTVVPQSLATPLHLHVGSTLEYTLLGGGTFTLRVVGIIDPSSLSPSFGGGLIASAAFLRPYATYSPLSRAVLYLQFSANHDSPAASRINRDLPQVFAFDINALVPLIDRILDRATIFPLVLAALSLFAGAVILANTVALAVLERRREIGVMKALGARGGTILRLLLLESALVGLMGGAMGMGMAMIATLILDNVALNIPTTFDPLVIGGLVAVSVVLALLASLISAFPASREKPLIVLRYE
ncbi:MAG TPA: FtsX-like permease family protein [Chloroflexota bacterium]|jgi:predicted lysophospholipase L1 biosynthesis ABC-type transport system permease subunit